MTVRSTGKTDGAHDPDRLWRFSLEVTTKDLPSLKGMMSSGALPLEPVTPVMIPHLANDTQAARLEAIRTIRTLGLLPVPHFSARRLASKAACETLLAQMVTEAGIERCFIVAGDPSEPAGPFADSAALLATGLFEKAGIRVVDIGGYPEGHALMTPEQGWTVLEHKCRDIEARGMTPEIVTQFGFDAQAIMAWLMRLRERGITCHVRIGVPGPASIASLLRFAARCGVGASASVLSRYGISLGKLLGSAGPDQLITQLEEQLVDAHGPVSLHFYPFGNLGRTMDWIGQRIGKG
ncbi:methylenetetrahydrofolate reductase [Asaia bogorensis]|uniref:methylenetetrahydrofolate reductase n=1 Tax=Asaia bogorensis TaxID=91915 RepID=UPI000EFC5BCC|nr:methylenetetrahydrofolate reductase [Asaia bogorensis]